MVPQDGGHDHPVGKLQLGDGVIYPGVMGSQVDLDKMNGGFLSVLAHPFDAGVLVDESGGNDTGGDGHDAYAQEGDEDAEQFPQDSNRINVPVSYGEQGGSGPPDAGEGVGEHFRLGFVFQAVHAQAGPQHQHNDDEDRREQLLFLADNNFRDHVEGVVVGVDAEQAEDPDDPEHPEGNGACREEKGQVMGQEGQKVHDAGE